MKTIGYKLTALSPTRGASAELAASLTVVSASYVGLPVSISQISSFLRLNSQFLIAHVRVHYCVGLFRFQPPNVLSAPLLVLVVSKDGGLCSGCHLPKFASVGSLSFLPQLCYLPVFSLSATSRLLPWIPLSMLLQCKLHSRHEIGANITK